MTPLDALRSVMGYLVAPRRPGAAVLMAPPATRDALRELKSGDVAEYQRLTPIPKRRRAPFMRNEA